MNLEHSTTIAETARPVPVAAPVQRSFLSAIHVPESQRHITLPITPKSIAMLVAGWLVLLVALNALVGFFVEKPKLSQVSPAPAGAYAKLAPDDERRANIDSLQATLEKYYESFGNYPSTSQINSIMFREGDPSFKRLNRQTYIDPAGRTANLANSAVKNAYFYTPLPVGCDSGQTLCRGYTVGTTLSSGEVYSQHNSSK